MTVNTIFDCETGEFIEEPIASPTFADRQAAMRDAVRTRRWQVETGGIVVEGAPIRTDEGSRGNITSAVALFDNDPTLSTIDFEAQPGIWVTLDEETMRAIGVAVGRHAQACRSHARALDEALAAATTEADLDAIDIDAGWPGSLPPAP